MIVLQVSVGLLTEDYYKRQIVVLIFRSVEDEQ